MTKLLDTVNSVIWGAPALVGILGVGLYLSIRMGFVQLRLLPEALRVFFARLIPKKQTREARSSFQALCTALAATVGTGNLVGVAGAVCLGGPGAVFWMWLCGILGMATKYAEVVLAVCYRECGPEGYTGGPMYVITRGLGSRFRPLAVCYSLFGLVAAFGVGNMTQVNSVVSGLKDLASQFGWVLTWRSELVLGFLLAFLVGVLLLGGGKRIGAAAERLVPFAAAGYLLLCFGVLLFRAEAVPAAFLAIFQGAFSPRAVTGGAIGSAFTALRVGCSRGVFTNEAGMGTASIAHASAQVDHPSQQGLMGIMEVFLDTLVICTLTALVILVSGVPIPYGTDSGGTLTSRAFCAIYGEKAAVFLTLALVLFAVATILGWGLYGARCAQFLFGASAWKPFALCMSAGVVLGAVLDTAAVWQFSETLNGLMVIPNLIALAVLAPEAARLTKEYRKSGQRKAGGGNYANFNQCKPL